MIWWRYPNQPNLKVCKKKSTSTSYNFYKDHVALTLVFANTTLLRVISSLERHSLVPLLFPQRIECLLPCLSATTHSYKLTNFNIFIWIKFQKKIFVFSFWTCMERGCFFYSCRYYILWFSTSWAKTSPLFYNWKMIQNYIWYLRYIAI